MNVIVRRRAARVVEVRAGDACTKCGGRREIPKVPCSYDVWIRCPKCRGSGGRRPAP